MKSTLNLLILLFVAIAAGFGLPATSNTSPIGAPQDELSQLRYTNSQIKRLSREARTLKEYTALANYYWARQRLYHRKAMDEMHVWADRSEMINPLSEKWPRPVDSARNLHDYYEYEAARSGALFAKFDHLADTAPSK